MKDFFTMMKETEWRMTFTKEKHIKRYKRLLGFLAEKPTMEMSIVCDACATVLHDKYKMSWEEIEEIELSTYC